MVYGEGTVQPGWTGNHFMVCTYLLSVSQCLATCENLLQREQNLPYVVAPVRHARQMVCSVWGRYVYDNRCALSLSSITSHGTTWKYESTTRSDFPWFDTCCGNTIDSVYPQAYSLYAHAKPGSAP